MVIPAGFYQPLQSVKHPVKRGSPDFQMVCSDKKGLGICRIIGGPSWRLSRDHTHASSLLKACFCPAHNTRSLVGVYEEFPLLNLHLKVFWDYTQLKGRSPYLCTVFASSSCLHIYVVLQLMSASSACCAVQD